VVIAYEFPRTIGQRDDGLFRFLALVFLKFKEDMKNFGCKNGTIRL